MDRRLRADQPDRAGTRPRPRLTVDGPEGHARGQLPIGVRGTNQGRTAILNLPVTRGRATTRPRAIPYGAIQLGVAMGHSWANVRVLWPAATDPTSPIAGYELQRSRTAALGRHDRADRTPARDASSRWLSTTTYRFRVRAVDRGRELESVGVDPELDPPPRVSTTGARQSSRSGSWTPCQQLERVSLDRCPASSSPRAPADPDASPATASRVVGSDERRSAARPTSISTASSSGRSA